MKAIKTYSTGSASSSDNAELNCDFEGIGSLEIDEGSMIAVD
ncbi:MAG: hypothetical protein WAM27_01120 [Nitrososphaeraceae archaeon]